MIRRAIAISLSSNGRRQKTVSVATDNQMRRCIKLRGPHFDTHILSSQRQSRMYTAAAFTSSINNGIGCNSGHAGSSVAMGSPLSLAAVGRHNLLRSPLYNNLQQQQHSSFFHTSTPVWNKKKKKKRGGGGKKKTMNRMKSHLKADLEDLIGIPYGSFNFQQDIMNSSSSTPRPSHPSKRERRRNKRHSNMKQHQSTYQHETHSKSGRLIMTNEKLQQLLDNDSHQVPPPIITKYVSDNAKNLIHSAQSKMLYTHKYEHEALGPNNDRLFYATLHTEFSETSCFPSNVIIPQSTTSIQEDNGKENTLHLVNIGAARSKKRAETLAATDFILNLHELGINIQSPPDLAAIKRLQKDEIIKSKIVKSQMILEVLNVSRPIVTTSEYQRGGGGYITNIEFYCRGTPISITGSVGKSKSEAEGNAMIEIIQQGSIFYNFIGSKKMNDILTQIDESPGGHVAALQIKPLPEEALDVLNGAGLGNDTKHWERMEEHDKLKKRYEEEFHARQQMKNQDDEREGGRFSSFLDKRGNNGAEVNEIYIKEEESRLEKAVNDPEGKQGQMKSVRDALPIKAIREDLIDALKTQQVVVVSGGTGSGKSTQCPQYILEDAIAYNKGSDTRIVVTQPRRIAAISVAERIANERDEEVGKSVGYAVRFNKKAPRDSASIEFVTTGILLRRLINDPSLSDISHVMIDEVHERDIDTDFLLVLLRDLLKKRPELRVILMSATLDAESFGEYFSNEDDSTSVPVMSVPTKPRHPVEVIQLEDMAGDGKVLVDDIPADVQGLAQSLLRLQDLQLQLDLEEAIAEDAAALRIQTRSLAEDEGNISNDEDDTDSSDSDSDSSDDEGSSSLQSSSSSKRLKALRRAVAMRSKARGQTKPISNAPVTKLQMSEKKEIGELTTRLVAKLAEHVAKVELDAGRKGSVLCFFPGLDEIKEAMSILEEDSSLKKKIKVLPLHSTIPQQDQQKVFIPADYGTVKVILATNIAESSVTIDDVLAVVDSGLVRELNWDAEKSMSTMVTVPTSKASATQRLGRAGRVAPGKCYRIYSRGQHEAMPERPLPEIQRSALEATCLNTCTMTSDTVETFLSRAMDPPKQEAVSFSMDRLKKLGAISVGPSSAETLTPLGQFLSRLPLDPAIGKMLILGCVMQCLDPVLTAAALACSREVFFTPAGAREEQRKVRKSFDETSDTLASMRAYEEYQDVLRDNGWSDTKQWAYDNYVSINAISSVHSIRQQLVNELHRLGLVHNSDLDPRSRGRNKQLRPDAAVNRNAGVELLYTGVWACGAPDNLAARRRRGNFGTLRTRTENHSGLHPSSVAFHRKPPKGYTKPLPPWFLYREMVLSSQVFLRGCTSLSPEQALLFGGYELSDQGRGPRLIDDWIIVEGAQCSQSLNVLSNVRREINAALDLKVMNPRRPLPEAQQLMIDAVGDCFDMLNDDDLTY